VPDLYREYDGSTTEFVLKETHRHNPETWKSEKKWRLRVTSPLEWEANPSDPTTIITHTQNHLEVQIPLDAPIYSRMTA
jgi:hypothetical protein